MKTSRFEFKIDKAVNCIFIRHYGFVDLASILDRGNAILNHEDYQAGLNRITDYTDTETDLNSDDIRFITENISSRLAVSGTYKEAVIVNDLLSFGLVRVFHTLSDVNANEYEIFSHEFPNNLEKMKNWLGLPTDFIFPHFLSLK